MRSVIDEMIDDRVAQDGIRFRPVELVDGSGLVRFLKRTYRYLMEQPVETERRSPAAAVVQSEVETTLSMSEAWYVKNGDQDGTPAMYATDVVNRLRRLYDIH